MSEALPCPGCGSLLDQTDWGEELCPGCLLRLALQPSAVEVKRAAELETDYLPARAEGPLGPGRVLGNRYAVRKLLGRGGMGEVWRAYDLKLRVDVALKALRDDLFRDRKRLELLRQEVRAAREVVSPNVCRIFDLIEADGTELVSMEYVDGATLLEVLQEGGPLALEEARDIASQFLAGLEAIHQAGLVHRDVKPENIMITRAGRVVVMDFGLARQEDSGAGTVAGTPAYMAPEQAAGLQVDARADVYAAGVVLAEMVSPEGVTDPISRQSIWAGIRSEPVRVPETPWAPVIARAVAKDRDQRYGSAHTLIRALEDRTLRVAGAEDLNPYPGLASFTESDAEFFFGREAEVERLWRRLDRPHLLGVVGPSGSGKTSFLRAGLIASAAEDWSIVRCTPGDAVLASLRRALASEISDDPAAVGELAAGDADSTVSAFARWQTRQGHALLIVDQFEELFTLNPADDQAEVAALLSRLPLEADVFVLLAMRDDFLMGCREHQPLAPIFEDLTALPSLAGGALRRAVVQPAARCGYRFEDDDLIDEMLAEVEGERGALPLLAFAMARLWEKRDRENGILTRQASHDIGGVGGALARHAEETIDRIGSGRAPIVRELFRNLVTAEGTRAVREWDELLSVFGGPQQPSSSLRASGDPVRLVPLPHHSLRAGPSTRSLRSLAQDDRRGAAEQVLHALVDARLLTSYEVHEEDREPVRRVEIIHESLLANWPRLVGWQTQDADSARLRDELRQAARIWDEHGRHDDRLWTGTAYREFALWRERYPGGLTENEEAFGRATTALASRRRRRRRLAVSAGVSALIVILAVVTVLWRRSVLHQRLAEAQKLIALAQLQLDDHPTAALAHVTRSIELADTEEARLLALEILWQGPTAFAVSDVGTRMMHFSPGGKWLVQGQGGSSSLTLISRDGQQRVLAHPTGSDTVDIWAAFGGSDDIFLSGGFGTDARHIALWSAAEGRLVASLPVIDGSGLIRRRFGIGSAADQPRAVIATGTDSVVTVDALYGGGGHHRLGTIQTSSPVGEGASFNVPRASADWIGVVEGIGSVEGSEVSIVRVGVDGLSDRRLIGRHRGGTIASVDADPLGRYLVTVDQSGGIRLWDAVGRHEPARAEYSGTLRLCWPSEDGSHFFLEALRPEEAVSDVWVWSVDDFSLRLRRKLVGVKLGGDLSIDPVGLRLAMRGPNPVNRLWSLRAPAGAEPIMLRVGSDMNSGKPNFSPDGRWLATGHFFGLKLWPLAHRYPAVIRPEVATRIGTVRFGPEGRFLAAAADTSLSLLPLDGPVPAAGHTIFEIEGDPVWDVAVSPDGRRFAVADMRGRMWVGSDDGAEPRQLEGAADSAVIFSPDGRLVASNPAFYGGEDAGFRIWDAETGDQVAELRLPDAEFRMGAGFTSDGRLLTGTSKGVVAWDLETGDHELLLDFDVHGFVASADGRRLLLTDAGGETDLMLGGSGGPVYIDLDSGEVTPLKRHGVIWPLAMALDREGRMVATGDDKGVIRVGPVSGGEPHMLLGHDHEIISVAIDPLGRWIASSATDNTFRLWPMPDLSKRPLHTLPREELIAKLKTLTNLRVVSDEESSTGWTLTHEPFQGWETAPTW